MKTPRIAQLEAAIAALGRPGMQLTVEDDTGAQRVSFRALSQSLAAKKAWDAAHPEKASEYFRLCAELDAEIKREERAVAERITYERVLRQASVKLERSGIGERSLAAANDPEDTEALGAVKRWLTDASKTWLVLSGPRGTGKSVAATWAVMQAIRTGSTGAFRTFSTVAKLSQFDAGAAELDHLKRVDLLVLDDVGTEVLSDWARAQVHELCDYRHEHYARTIITSNLMWRSKEPGKSLEERLGDRIVDRIAQAGTNHQLSAKPSMRRGGV